MKRFAKVLAVLLIVSMFMAFGLTAHAVDQDRGSIIIERLKSPDPNHSNDYIGSYSIYKLFDATVALDENGVATGAISYTCTDEQKAIEGFGTFFTADAMNNVSAKEAAVGEDGYLSAEAIAWIREHLEKDKLGEKIEPVSYSQWQRAGSDPTKPYYTGGGGTYSDNYTVHNLKFGYYFVDSNVGSAVMINTLKPNATIAEKNLTPGFEKTITDIKRPVEGEGGEMARESHKDDVQQNTQYVKPGHAATVQVGDLVEYTLHVTARKTAEAYTVTDRLSYGLTLQPDSVKVTDSENKVTEADYEVYTSADHWIRTYVNGEDYRLVVYDYQTGEIETLKTGKTSDPDYVNIYDSNLVVIFKQAYLDGITADRDITITYDSLVNEYAIVGFDAGGGYGNNNDADLYYGHTHNIDDRTVAYSARIKVYKYEGDGTSVTEGSKPLSGVHFVLTDDQGRYLCRDAQNLIYWGSEADAVDFVTGEGEYVKGAISFTRYNNWTNTDEYGYYTNTNNPFRSLTPMPPNEEYYGRLYPGPDGAYDTVDDFWMGSNIFAKPGPDGTWNTEDDYRLLNSGTGGFTIEGLGNGTYTLIETQALPGYNVAAPVTVEINNQNNTFPELRKQVDVVNHTGTELPNTGGMGVTLFYLLGGMSILLGAALLLRKKSAQGV